MIKQKPDIRRIGYARVSTDDQRLDLQIIALKRAGVQDDDLYIEKKSAASNARPQLALALKALHPGDTFIVWKLDRLGRSIDFLRATLNRLREMNVKLVSLTETVDTSTPMGEVMFNVIASLAELERNLTRERTRAGLAVLRAKGVKLGAKKKFTPEKVAQAKRLLLQPGWTVPKVAKKMKLSPSLLFQSFPGGRRALLAIEARKRKVRKK